MGWKVPALAAVLFVVALTVVGVVAGQVIGGLRGAVVGAVPGALAAVVAGFVPALRDDARRRGNELAGLKEQAAREQAALDGITEPVDEAPPAATWTPPAEVATGGR